MQLIVSPVNRAEYTNCCSKLSSQSLELVFCFWRCCLYSLATDSYPWVHVCNYHWSQWKLWLRNRGKSLFPGKLPYGLRALQAKKGSLCHHCGSFNSDNIQNEKNLHTWNADVNEQDSILIWLSHLILTNCQNNNKRIANLKYWRFHQQPTMNREIMSPRQPLGRDRCSPWNCSDWEFQTVPFDFLWNLIFTK